MKKFISIPGMLAIAAVMLVASCKKDKPAAATGADALTATRASISFTSSPAFAGSGTYTSTNDATSHATTTTSGTDRTITLSTTLVSGTSVRAAALEIFVSSTASTSAGSITGNFQSTSSTFDASLILSSGAGAYEDLSGTVTITKLSATEVEGTFTCTVEDASGGGAANLSLTGGSFAGKF